MSGMTEMMKKPVTGVWVMRDIVSANTAAKMLAITTGMKMPSMYREST